MRLAVGIADPRRQRNVAPAQDHGASAILFLRGNRFGETELRLPAADQFQIHLGQNFGIEQGAMLGAA